MLALLPLAGVNAACTCGAGQSAGSAAVQPVKNESLPVSGLLLSVADAIVAEGTPPAPGLGRRHSTPLVRVDDSGLIQAYLYCKREHCMGLADAILDAGGRVELVQTQATRPLLQAWIPAAYLRPAAALDGVESVVPPSYAHTR